jgi:hypothetical protein
MATPAVPPKSIVFTTSRVIRDMTLWLLRAVVVGVLVGIAFSTLTAALTVLVRA